VCLYSCLRYPTPKSHLFCAAVHFCLWPVGICPVSSPHYLINGTIFGGKRFERKMCVLNFCTFFLRHFPYYEEFSDTVMSEHRPYVQLCPSLCTALPVPVHSSARPCAQLCPSLCTALPVPMYSSARHYCPILTKLEFSRHIL
jgi:hypothetical protein